jgi:hypothetical protein
MASQVQLTNTFNEFRQAYNDAANDISTLQSSNTAIFSAVNGANSLIAGVQTGNTALYNGTAEIYTKSTQVADLTTTGSRVVFGTAPVSGSGAVLDDDDGFIYHSGNNSAELSGAITTGGNATVGGALDVGSTSQFDGNATFGTNQAIIVASNGTFLSSTGNIELNNTSSSVNAYHIHATLHVAAGGNIENWASGKGTDPEQHRIGGIGTVDGPIDMVIVNESDQPNAYAEFIAVNDTGDIENGWISMGINSSNYGEAEYGVTKNDDGYILYQPPSGTSANGDLVIGTGSNGTKNRILFSANGFDDPANNTQMTIVPGERVVIQINTESANTSSGALVVQGGLGLTGNLNVGGNVAITGTITLGGGGNTVTTDSLAVENPIIFVGQNNAADTFDLGFVGVYNDGAEKYTGIVRDASENGMYKLFANSSILPANTVDFTDGGIQYGSVMVGEARIVNPTASSSNVTGALVVTGGVGISGEVHTSGLIRATNDTPSTSTSSGAITVAGGVGVAGNTHIGGDLVVAGAATFTGGLRAQELIEDVIDSSASTNQITMDYTAGNIFYETQSLSADFWPKLTNIPTDNGRATTISLFVPQGATARRPAANTIQVNGTNVAISWVGGNTGVTVTASKLDIFNFTVLRRSNTFTVIGTLSGNTSVFSI